jgi:hypothetical protein
MRKIKEVLRLKFELGLAPRQIARSNGCGLLELLIFSVELAQRSNQAMRTRAVCTIFTLKYLPRAKTFYESFRSVSSATGADFLAFAPDLAHFSEEALASCDFDLASPEDIMSQDKFTALSFQYDVVELCTACKPFLLHYLLEKYEQVIYLDPDILLLSPIDSLFSALKSCNVLLTPHTVNPLDSDHYWGNEIILLRSGTYNLGFIGLARSSETARFLSWWSERLEKYCIRAPESGMFVDQKWIDLIPGMFDGVRILRDKEVNVANWNVEYRGLEESDGVFYIDGRPLVFYHFSNFDPNEPDRHCRLHKHLEQSELRALDRLYRLYARLLYNNGENTFKDTIYAFGVFTNGVPVDSVCRKLFSETLARGMLFPNPHDVASTPSFFDWLNQSINGKPRGWNRPLITHYLYGWLRFHGYLRITNWFGSPLGRGLIPCLLIIVVCGNRKGIPKEFLQHLPKNRVELVVRAALLLIAQGFSAFSYRIRRRDHIRSDNL